MSEMTVLDPLPLPSLLSVRGWRQYYQSWLRALLSPGVRSDVLEEIRGRVRRGGEGEAGRGGGGELQGWSHPADQSGRAQAGGGLSLLGLQV